MQKYDKIMLETAKLWAKQSYCKRAQVGAVVAKEGRILSVGYRLLDYIKNNGKDTEIFPVFDGNVCVFKKDDKVVLFADGEFGIIKAVEISKEEYERLLKGE